MADWTCASIQVISDYRAELGETPIWCERSQSLLWVDILQQCLLRYWPAQNGRTEIHAMPPFTSAVLLTEQEEVFLAVSQSGITLYDYARQQFERLCDYPADAGGTRPNEAAISPDGALWFSTMDIEARGPIGSWYRFALGDTSPQRVLGDQLVPNTLQWHAGNLWFADSLRHHFYCAQHNAAGLTILATHEIEGIPDGSTLTDAGQLINARWGQARLVHYQLSVTQMTELSTLALPVTQPSSCTFGGPTLSDLFITSARVGLALPGRTDGALLCVATTLTGQPSGQFRTIK